MSKFKVGDRVRIIENTSESVNKIGDVGIVTEVHGGFEIEYRVKVGDQIEFANWQYEHDLELISTNTLQVGETYTSKNGSEWECIFVRDGKAWMIGVYPDGTTGSAYDFNIDGTASWAGGSGADGYNIKWGPKRETVTAPVTYVVHTDGCGDFFRGHDAYIGRETTPLSITFDLIDGTPDWTTAKVSPCD